MILPFSASMIVEVAQGSFYARSGTFGYVDKDAFVLM
jgi:hypothetical protein